MKLRIIDLMDYYQGNPSVPLTPYRKTAVHRAGEFRNEEKRAKAGRIKQGMMAAALPSHDCRVNSFFSLGEPTASAHLGKRGGGREFSSDGDLREFRVHQR